MVLLQNKALREIKRECTQVRLSTVFVITSYSYSQELTNVLAPGRIPLG